MSISLSIILNFLSPLYFYANLFIFFLFPVTSLYSHHTNFCVLYYSSFITAHIQDGTYFFLAFSVILFNIFHFGCFSYRFFSSLHSTLLSVFSPPFTPTFWLKSLLPHFLLHTVSPFITSIILYFSFNLSYPFLGFFSLVSSNIPLQ